MSFTLTLTLTCLFTSCDKEISFKGKYDGEKLVMYCLANPDNDQITVILRQSQFFLKEYEQSVFAGVKGATVTGEIGGRKVVFTEVPVNYDDDQTPPEGYPEDNDYGYDWGWRPDHSAEEGIYACDYTPKEGDVITIHASKEGFKDIEAKIEVPKKPSFEVKVDRITRGTDNESQSIRNIHIKVTIHDDGKEENYYKLRALQKVYRYIPDEDDWYYDENYDYSTESANPEGLTIAVSGTNAAPRTTTKTGSSPLTKGYYSSDEYYYSTVSCWTRDPLFSDNSLSGLDDIEDVIDGKDRSRYSIYKIIEDSTFNGEDHTFEVVITAFPDAYFDEDGNLIDYSKVDWTPDVTKFSFSLESVTRSLYLYDRSLEAEDNSDGGFFSEPVAVYSNIKNGIGLIAASSSVMIQLKNQ